MFTNVAYLGRHSEDITDTSEPLLITAVGYYRNITKNTLTSRPSGRGDYQLIYVADGQARLTVDGKERRLGKGNMILFRPSVPQKYSFYAEDSPQIYWVHFTGSDIDKILARYNMPTDKSAFFAGTSSEYEWIYSHMIRELQLRRANYKDMLCNDMHRLLMLIDRYFSEMPSFNSNTIDEIERAVHYFNNNYNADVSIEEYAKQRHISACWFIRSFTQLTRLTPMQYVISVRIANAKSLLGDTSLSIAQVASAVGYENALYFSRIFKKHTGLSPREYRQSANSYTYAQKQ
jgi:AraC-like DNA-binding protein